MISLPADYHMHTHLCRHAVGTASELAAQAVRLGLPEIGFTEHAPMIRDDWDDWHISRSDLPTYLAQVQAARIAFPQLPIKLALEVDFIPGHETWIRDLATRQPWDYLIGAVHYVSDTWALDNPHLLAEWQTRDAYEIWSEYFERLTRAVESGLFDIIAHADLCKKFGFYPKQDCTPLYERFLSAVKDQGIAIELNTAGLRKECREIYPSGGIARMAFAKGIPITFASDAHAPGEVGASFDQALALARAAGYKETCRFDQRRRTMVPL